MASQESFRQFTLKGVHVTENELGHGAYAVVLELKYQGLKCAGKKLYRVFYESGIGPAAQRFLEECQLLSETRHPNIVRFIGVFFEEGSQLPLLVMEFLPINLSNYLDQYGILSDEISYSILHDVSLGLAYLHGHTPVIVHRDLSANNVLLSDNMEAKISDLGVARIINLTPLQVTQMTRAPGTPAYMAPELMTAKPRYDTSVDVFSFGVMMIHVFTAEWPLPTIGPTRADPTNPDKLIGVSEVERREEFMQKITQDHPLMDLIKKCLNNNPRRRPQADVIVGMLRVMVLEKSTTIENRVEMLRRIDTLATEKRDLEQDNGKKDMTIEEQAKDNEQISDKNRQLKQEIMTQNSVIEEKARDFEQLAREYRELDQENVKKDYTIEKQVGEIERLRQQKEIQKEESESTIERIQLESSLETEKRKKEIMHLKGQLEEKQTLVEKLRVRCDELIAEVQQQIANADTSRSKEATLTSQVAALTVQVDVLSSQMKQEKRVQVTIIASKDATITSLTVSKDSTIASVTASKDALLAAKENKIAADRSALQTKNATIDRLEGQLMKAREYLASKPQPIQVQVSYSQCSEAPTEMEEGNAVMLNSKIYFGGGDCWSDHDDSYFIHCYDPSQDTWSGLPKLPVCWFGMGKVNNELVTVGGIEKFSSAATNEVLTFSAKRRWEQSIPPMPTARNSPAVASLPSHLVVAGGVLSTNKHTDIVEIYDINTYQWSKSNRLPYTCRDAKATVCNNTVYLLGGHNDKHLKNALFALADQLITNSLPEHQQEGHTNSSSPNKMWQEIASTPSYRPSTITARVSDTFHTVMIGGMNSGEVNAECESGIYAYSMSTDSWVHIGNLPYPVAYTATVSLSPTEFLLISGRNENGELQRAVHKATLNLVF